MSQEFLSQDEVDALLRGVTGEVAEEQPEQDPNEVRAYNFAKQERIVRGRMPTLELINERFARSMRIALFNFMRRSAEISVGPVRVLKYSEFVRNLVVPTNLNLVQIKPLRGTSLFIFEPNLVFLVIDNLFGGDGRFHTRIEGRDFTATEQRIINRLLGLALDSYTASWKPVYPVNFEYVRSEMNPQFANVATPNEVVVTTSFKIELGSDGGEFHICMPYAMVEPIRAVLASSLQGEQLEVDKRWLNLLSYQVQDAVVQLNVNLGTIETSFGSILNWKVGDVIDFDVPRTVSATVDNVPVFEGGYGISNGKYAVRVGKMLVQSNIDTIAGEQNV
jgi:flagellar motor switch protein FliM